MNTKSDFGGIASEVARLNSEVSTLRSTVLDADSDLASAWNTCDVDIQDPLIRLHNDIRWIASTVEDIDEAIASVLYGSGYVR